MPVSSGSRTAGTPIRSPTQHAAPYFLATKLEAVFGRGGGDYAASHDLEDFVAVVDGRPQIEAEVAGAAPDVRTYLADKVAELLSTPAFVDALAGHLPGDPASQARLPSLEAKLRRISEGARPE